MGPAFWNLPFAKITLDLIEDAMIHPKVGMHVRIRNEFRFVKFDANLLHSQSTLNSNSWLKSLIQGEKLHSLLRRRRRHCRIGNF